MKIFTPTRGQKKTELPPDPHCQYRQNFDTGGSDGIGSGGVAVIPEKNMLEPHSHAPKKEMQTANDQPRPAPPELTKPTAASVATLQPLPLELCALVRAAGAGTLPKGAVSLETGFTVDLERYVLGFAAQYLIGDQAHEILELRACLRAWQVLTRKVISA